MEPHGFLVCCRIARQILQSLPPIFDMLVLLIFVMLVFSVLGKFNPFIQAIFFKELITTKMKTLLPTINAACLW